MQTGPISDSSIRRRSLAAKLLIGLARVAIIALAVSFLVFNPPQLPQQPLFRVASGVGGIGFFNASCGQRDDKHGYSYRFTKKDVRCIFAELHIPPNAPDTTIHVIFYDVNGQVMHEKNLPVGKESSAMIVGVYEGQDEPGHWQPGIYRMEFLVADELIATDEFQIRDPLGHLFGSNRSLRFLSICPMSNRDITTSDPSPTTTPWQPKMLLQLQTGCWILWPRPTCAHESVGIVVSF